MSITTAEITDIFTTLRGGPRGRETLNNVTLEQFTTVLSDVLGTPDVVRPLTFCGTDSDAAKLVQQINDEVTAVTFEGEASEVFAMFVATLQSDYNEGSRKFVDVKQYVAHARNLATATELIEYARSVGVLFETSEEPSDWHGITLGGADG